MDRMLVIRPEGGSMLSITGRAKKREGCFVKRASGSAVPSDLDVAALVGWSAFGGRRWDLQTRAEPLGCPAEEGVDVREDLDISCQPFEGVQVNFCVRRRSWRGLSTKGSIHFVTQ